MVGITIGIDLGDIWSHYCTLSEDGEVADRGRFRTNPSGVSGHTAKDSTLRRWGLSLGARGGSHARRRAVNEANRKLAASLLPLDLNQHRAKGL